MSNDTSPEKQPIASSGGPERIASFPSRAFAPVGLVISFWTISYLGGWILYYGWKRDEPHLAIWRCATFIVLIAGVHLLGYCLWKRQFGQVGDEDTNVRLRRVSSAYWPPMKSALLQQDIIIILASLVLDLGQAISLTTVAIAAYWLAFGVVVFRRPTSPTAGDILYVRRGFLLILLAAIGIGPILAKVLDRW